MFELGDFDIRTNYYKYNALTNKMIINKNPREAILFP